MYDLGLAKLAKEREKMSPVPRPSLDISGAWRPSLDMAMAKLSEAKTVTRTQSELLQIDAATCGKIEQIVYPWSMYFFVIFIRGSAT